MSTTPYAIDFDNLEALIRAESARTSRKSCSICHAALRAGNDGTLCSPCQGFGDLSIYKKCATEGCGNACSDLHRYCKSCTGVRAAESKLGER
jgi:hypothetical protein